mmetsp:Transcript_44046/g.86377  ORF Transcript_44046/g.86377 Transcript_44046/m.86377 type:complete len:220 (+) Transcript_44046:462-1121(+)
MEMSAAPRPVFPHRHPPADIALCPARLSAGRPHPGSGRRPPAPLRVLRRGPPRPLRHRRPDGIPGGGAGPQLGRIPPPPPGVLDRERGGDRQRAARGVPTGRTGAGLRGRAAAARRVRRARRGGGGGAAAGTGSAERVRHQQQGTHTARLCRKEKEGGFCGAGGAGEGAGHHRAADTEGADAHGQGAVVPAGARKGGVHVLDYQCPPSEEDALLRLPKV